MRRLFNRVDPRVLERYTPTSLPRRVKPSLAKVRRMDALTRAFQALPPRELLMLYAHKVLGTAQEDIATLFNVQQSNVSYRLVRAETRLRLYDKLASAGSETRARRDLAALGFAEPQIRVVLGVVRTTSQTATAAAYGCSQGSVRHVFASALERVRRELPESPTRGLLEAVEANYNQLRAIQSQRRWAWKVGGTNYVAA